MAFGRRTPLTLLEKAKSVLVPRSGMGRVVRYAKLRLQRLPGTPHVIALGFACGAAISFTPFIGFHFLLGGLLAWVVGGSIIASAMGTFVGNPWTFPFIWIFSFRFGYTILGREHDDAIAHGDLKPDELIMSTEPGLWERIVDVIWPMLVGSIPMGVIAGIVCYLIMRPIVATYQKRRRDRLAGRATKKRKLGKEASVDDQQ